MATSRITAPTPGAHPDDLGGEPPSPLAPGLRRPRVPVRTRLDFWLDMALLVAFSLDYSFNFTGLT